MRKKWVTAPCAVLLSVLLTACSMDSDLGSLTGNRKVWVDSDLIGAVKEADQIREQDDFAAAVNGGWKLEQGDKYYGTFQDVSDSVLVKKKQVVTDTSIPGYTAELLRTYYQLASDWDERNAAGAEPLRPYIEDIASIDSVEGLYDFFADPVRNPLFLAPLSTDLPLVMHSEKHDDSYAVFFSSPNLSLTYNNTNDCYFKLDSEESFEHFGQVKKKALYMLDKFGYSEKEASDLLGKCMAWEKKVATADDSAAIEDPNEITFSHEEAVGLTKGFPFDKILSSWGFKDAKYIVIRPSYAAKLEQLCSQGNLDNIKAFLIVNYCLNCSSYLDRETYDRISELGLSGLRVKDDYGKTDEQKEDELIFNTYIGQSPMVGAMNRVYVENFFDASQVAELNGITQDLIREFKEVFSEEEWLSEKGKKACIDKLEALKVHVAYQDFDSVDYEELDFKSADEGGSFLEAWFAAKRFGMEHTAWLADQPYDAAYWDPVRSDLSTTVTNAVYMPMTNGIYIFAGICEAPVYSMDLSYEEKLAGLFTVVGHEITHGFDKTGALYDKNGIKNPWLPVEDQAAFNDKSDKVGIYYTTLSPQSGFGLYEGTRVNAEATADMGGLRATLHLAKDTPGFDYDKYFRAYARMWKLNVPVKKEKDNFQYDSHPLAFYRINVGLQQFDEFYETYDVKKGDGMYLDPKDRIKVW